MIIVCLRSLPAPPTPRPSVSSCLSICWAAAAAGAHEALGLESAIAWARNRLYLLANAWPQRRSITPINPSQLPGPPTGALAWALVGASQADGPKLVEGPQPPLSHQSLSAIRHRFGSPTQPPRRPSGWAGFLAFQVGWLLRPGPFSRSWHPPDVGGWIQVPSA